MASTLHKPSVADQEASVTAWNSQHPVGTAVDVHLWTGETKRTITTTPAQMLSGHTAVIWLKGVSGCYALRCVKAVQS
jgi:hypothetical protein